MKYFCLGTILIVLLGCNTPSDRTIPADSLDQVAVSASSAPVTRIMTQLLSDYLQMKSFFADPTDTLQIKQHAQEMIVWADSLGHVSGTIPAPLGDSLQIMSMAISDELIGLLGEVDKKGMAASFQLTGLQLYDLLRAMQYRGRKIYLFQSFRGGEGEAGWLDITPVSTHPFLASGEQEKAIDSLPIR